MALRDPRALLASLSKLEQLRKPDQCKGQRQFRRWVVRGQAEILPSDGQIDRSPRSVHLRDVGWGGVGFVCDDALPINSLWRLHFMVSGFVVGQQSFIVRHARQVDAGLYLIGGQFVLDAGMLCLLGVVPTEVQEGDGPEASSFSFQAPGDVA